MEDDDDLSQKWAENIAALIREDQSERKKKRKSIARWAYTHRELLPALVLAEDVKFERSRGAKHERVLRDLLLELSTSQRKDAYDIIMPPKQGKKVTWDDDSGLGHIGDCSIDVSRIEKP